MPRPALHSWRLPPSPPDTDHIPLLSSSGHPTDARRTSTLPYQNSTVDRTNLRNTRHLVVVIPSPDLPLDQGHLGNVLSTGPRNRIPQGILMPLLPSMVAQLNAIAREYNFPSTVGVCLYLRINENGISMSPRISDISWQHLFGHLFDSRPSSGSSQLPITGSIEFDIDLNKARWFEPWILGTWREAEPPSVISRSSLGTHWRGESQSMSIDEHSVEDDSGLSRPQFRHMPKKLSLVNRLELHGVHGPPRSQSDPSHTDFMPTHIPSSTLPSDIPQPTKSDLECRVSLWRDITDLHPVSMTETYQPAPDLGALTIDVTPMDEYALGHGIDQCHWSATSVGPRSPTMESRTVSPRPYPVHIDHCPIKTLPPTPKSWGPTDDDWRTVIPGVPRLPLPGVGQRVVEDVMVTRPRAVWGNSFGWRTAMTWKNVYPFAVIDTKPTIRVELHSSVPVPEYPDLVIYPAVDSRPDMRSLHKIQPLNQSVWGSSFGWQRAVTWRKTYPYSMKPVAPIQLRGAGNLEYEYPNLCIYPAVYPYFEIYPARVAQPIEVACDPRLAICPAVKVRSSSQVETKYPLNSVSTLYSNLVIYPAVYPHFDLYPKALQITETAEQKEIVVNNVCLTAEYPNMIIYPNVYPYLEIYPTRDMRRRASSTTWRASFGWPTGKTWLQVYPFHTACSRPTSKQSTSIPGSKVIANVALGKQSVWGSSFGWKSATTWRAVWPTFTRTHPNIGWIGAQNDSSYPHLVIYPAVYPHFDIYPPLAAFVEPDEPWQTKENKLTVNRKYLYPNLVIYPAVYPHFDLYPAPAVAPATGKRASNLRLRRIEAWRARTAALKDGLVAENHIWDVDEPFQLDLADFSWSPTTVGPSTSPLEPLSTPSIPGSVHMDRRVQGSVLLTPSTATTWGPQDDDWYSETDRIERLPSPDLGQRMVDDIEAPCFPRQPWNMVWPFFSHVSQATARSSSLYPQLVIYPPVYPHFDLYPARANASTLKDQATEAIANSNAYPVFDIYPAIYPHFNIYPAVDPQIEIPRNVVSDVRHERVEVKLPSLYPNLDIYHPCYPYNLDCIYPFRNTNESTQICIEPPRGYPWLVIYPPVYPFIIPYPSCAAEVSLPCKPDQSLFPTMRKSVNVKLPSHYPFLDIYPAGYPWYLESIYPALSIRPEERLVSRQTRGVRDVDVDDLMPNPPRRTTQRRRKSHMELHASVFRCLEKRPSRNSKTHLQLHIEVFQNGAEWRPAARTRDLSPLRESQCCASPDNSTPRTSRPRSGTCTSQSPRVDGRLPHAARSLMPRGLLRRNASAPPSPPPNGRKERAKSPKRLLSVDLSAPQTSTPKFLTHGPRSHPTESLVMRRARLYEQRIVHQSSGIVGSNGTHAVFSAVTHSAIHD